MRRMIAFAGSLILMVCGMAAWAGGGIHWPTYRLANSMGGEGAGQGYVHLIVREVRVSPIVAHVGDPVRFDMVIENRGEGMETVQARILANGKEVAGRLFTYGTRGSLNTLYRESFTWNTKGAKPGEYRIRGEVPIFYNFSQDDTYLDVDRRLVLLEPGAPLPSGLTGKNEAMVRDPRYKPAPPEEAGGAPGY